MKNKLHIYSRCNKILLNTILLKHWELIIAILPNIFRYTAYFEINLQDYIYKIAINFYEVKQQSIFFLLVSGYIKGL